MRKLNLSFVLAAFAMLLFAASSRRSPATSCPGAVARRTRRYKLSDAGCSFY